MSTAKATGHRTLLTGVLVVVGVLVFAAAPAGAAERLSPVPTTSFGPLAVPNDIAVDQSTGNVFVADLATDSVSEFHRKSSTEYELVGTLTGSETPAGSFAFHENLPEPAAVAVDGPEGVMYVADIDHSVVDKFKLIGPGDYKYECVFTGWVAGKAGACHKNEEPATEAFGEVTGVAVDSHGYVFVSDYTHGVVDEFTPSGAAVEDQIRSALTTEASNLAVDSLDNVYLSHFDGGVQKLKVDYLTGQIESEEARFNSGPAYALGVDPSTNDVYIDLGSQVARYEPSGLELPSLSLSSAGSEGIAVNATTHEVYVADKSNERVDVFGFVTIPDVGPCEAPSTLHATSATLRSTVNPLGTSEASYRFQYGTSENYGLETEPTPVAGETTESAEAPVSELAPGTTYHCRLVATNSTGALNEGPDGTFTTPPLPPEVSGAAAVDVTSEGALFKGTVNPGNGQTSYHFAYGETAGDYTQSLPSIAIGSGLSPITVEQDSDVLKPGTTYHYALIAVNATEEVTGPDATFTTSTVATPPTVTPLASTGTATGITQEAATLTGSIATDGLPTTYEFEVGTTGAYGTQLFGQLPAGEAAASAVSVALSGLRPGVTYHYRLVVSNAAGVAYGADEPFTTTAGPPPIALPLAPLLIPFTAPAGPRSHSHPSSPPLSRAQKLAKALKVCERGPKSKRASCAKRAHGKYGAGRKRRRR